MKTKRSKLGRRGKAVLAVLVAVMFIGVATAALLPYFGKITTTATVNQAVLVDGLQYPESGGITDVIPEAYPGGECFCFLHWLENKGSVPIDINFEQSCSGLDSEGGYLNGDGITTYVLSPIHEVYNTYEKLVEADIIKEWSCCTVKWTVDIISDNIQHGVYGVGLAISLDGNTPSFQIYYANEAPNAPGGIVGWYYMTYPWGASPPVPVAQLPWITVNTRTGIPDKDPEGGERHFEISIDCNYLGCCGATYWWNMQLKTNLLSWVSESTSGWGGVVFGFLENHVGIPITFPYTLESGERLDFNLCYTFDKKIWPGIYTIVTTIT